MQRLFACCCFLEPNFIDGELLNELFPDMMNDDELQESLDFLESRGLIERDKSGESVGYAITHRCLQKEMRKFYGERCEEILNIIGECLAMRVKEPCNRDVQKKESIDLDFKQVKYLIIQLETNTNLRDLFTNLNDRLGYFYLYYEINYKKALDCFEQVSSVYGK